MTKFYIIFAALCFAAFCGLEYKGVSLDDNQTMQKPNIYSYHGGSSSRSRHRSGGGFYYSHK